jgi:hypothetical protein
LFQASTLRDTAAPHPDLHIADSIFFLIGDSALPNQTDWNGISRTVWATKYDLQLTTGGVSSAGTPATPDPPAAGGAE